MNTLKKLVRTIILVAMMAGSSLQAMFFWDANGTDPGSGGPTPTGTWGVDAYWNDAKIFDNPPDPSGSLGIGPTVAWTDGATAVFAAGDDATGAYTVWVRGTIKVADIHVDLGEVTFSPDSAVGGDLRMVAWQNLELTNNINRQISAGHKTDAAIARYGVPMNGARNLIRYKRGTVILAATNIYTGSTTIEGGVLQLGNSHVLPPDTTLVLANNDPFRTDFNEAWRYTPAVFATAGFSQNLGPLQLGGFDFSVERKLDLGSGASALAFADSSTEDWGGRILFIINYTPGADSLRFGVNASGLSAAQLSSLRFVDFANLPGRIDAQGYVTPMLPRLQVPTRASATTVNLAWSDAVMGKTYRVQCREDLSPGDWTDLADVPAFSSTGDYSDTTATGNRRYYRLMVLP